MAAMSVVGSATKTISGSWNPGVLGPWLAAAPVVAVGAPFGAIVVAMVSRRYTLMVVSALCVGQYVWACWANSIVGMPLLASILAIAAFNLIAHRLYERHFPRAERRADRSTAQRRRWGR
jgi:putative Ca2+/H+ antiporter (TMEM165/GDT1 family)